jgi:vacuolar-type H+-ATPase subunit I/STV1
MAKKLDKLWFGLLCGLLGPLLGMFIFYLLKFNDMPISGFLDVAKDPLVLSPMLSIGAFMINLGLFFLFLNRGWNQPARGVILSTFIYCAIVLILKGL